MKKQEKYQKKPGNIVSSITALSFLLSGCAGMPGKKNPGSLKQPEISDLQKAINQAEDKEGLIGVLRVLIEALGYEYAGVHEGKDDNILKSVDCDMSDSEAMAREKAAENAINTLISEDNKRDDITISDIKIINSKGGRTKKGLGPHVVCSEAEGIVTPAEKQRHSKPRPRGSKKK